LSGEPLRRVELLDDRHEVDDFDCGVRALDKWLRQSALTARAAGTAAA
jgi:hypothetical protein